MSSPQLNERQQNILTLVAEGKTNRQIADELYLTENTVKWYLQQIFQELGATNRTEAVDLARRHRLLQSTLAPPSPVAALPSVTTPFIEREKQLAELREMLLQSQPRLITIAGLGGVGKTRLSVEAARSVEQAFPDGVYFIPLETIDSASAFWRICLHHLQIPRLSRTPERILVREYLRQRRALLVLDNTEYLQRFASEIGWLLANTTYLKILSASRVRLNLQAEQFYPLDGLDYEAGTDSGSYRLFLHAARRHHPAFQPSASDQAHIVAFCQMVEGLPLAVELAATWMDVTTPDQLLPQFQRSLSLIEHKAADRPDRQRNLAAVVDYSWQFLSPEERQALIRLSPIGGAFTRSAAIAIARCSPAALKGLLHSSLLQTTDDNRLRIHQLIRQHAAEQAGQDSAELEDARDHHMTFMLQWLAQKTNVLRETMSASLVQHIAQEWQQVEPAWQRALQRGRCDLLEPCIDLMMYFEARGIWGEGLTFFERSRDALPANCPRLRARHEEVISALTLQLSDLPQAERLAQRALSALDTLPDPPSGPDPDAAGVYARITLATTSFIRGEYDQYTDFLKTLAPFTDAYLIKFAEINPHMLAGIHHCARLQYDAAVHNFQEIIAISDDDAYYLPAIRCMLGLSHLGQLDATSARHQFTLALQRSLEICVFPAIVSATYELNRLDYPHGDNTVRFRALNRLAADLSSAPTIARVALHNGTFYVTMGFYDRARELLRLSLQLLQGNTSSTEIAASTFTAGKLLLYELLHRRQMARAAIVPSP